MTKRIGSFNESNTKKLKSDSDLNNLWGEDLDAGDVDDCFLLASQVYEQDNVNCTQRNNVSILKPQRAFNGNKNEESLMCAENNVSIFPSYNAFKFNQKNLITSTQTALQSNSKTNMPLNGSFKFPLLNETSKCNEVMKSIRNNNVCSNHSLQDEVQKLQDECMAKEGEASILRSQLKQIRKSMEAEQTKKVQEWTEKLNTAEKEMKIVKCDLEFKNLEIANLKSKLIEMTKHFNPDISMSTVHFEERDENFGHNKHCKSVVNQYKIKTVLENETPLTAAVFSAIFNSTKSETYQTNLKYNGKCNQYLEKEEHVVSELRKINENKNFDLSCIYSDISALICCTTMEINSEKCYSYINRILWVTRLVVKNFLDYLTILQSNMQNEDIEQLDNLYLSGIFNCTNSNVSPFASKEWFENEIGIKSTLMVNLLSEILPFSSYLQRHLLENKPLVHKADDHAWQRFDFFTLISSALDVIGNIRKADSCVGFLSAVTLLLTNIQLSVSLLNCYSLVLSVTDKLVFTRPPKEAIKSLSRFFKTSSPDVSLVLGLCRIALQRNSISYSREGTLSFNTDTCAMQVYATLYEDNFINRYDSSDLDVNLNTLQFITNLLQSESLQMYFQETNYCECILKTINLCLEIMCEMLMINRNDDLASHTYKHRAIFQCCLRVLNILNFKFACLITARPEYKFIIESLIDIKELDLKDMNLEILENVNIQEDFPKISDSSFDSIPFWK